jgi:hypothetical protein
MPYDNLILEKRDPVFKSRIIAAQSNYYPKNIGNFSKGRGAPHNIHFDFA